ncbi:MAG: site-specific integrase [Proteobacteria bacterium]|nr:site-specific integrase [Pseudomonadota bacterium]MBU1711201.1 site-specific integrase [Pseudomonadota bacterium]
MKGSIHYRKDRGYWFISWWDSHSGKAIKIYYYKGERMYSEKTAEKLLTILTAEQEMGTLCLERYINPMWADTVSYLWEWLEIIQGTVSFATYKDYKNSIKNHLVPFFTKYTYQLHEIQYDILLRLMGTIHRTGKGKYNVMYCLHACLKSARRSKRIQEMPEFPEKRKYMIQEPVISWLPSERQEKVLRAIPEEHQPIFWWLKYHIRRPAEAMALHREDYDSLLDAFIIKRSISYRQYVDNTKTHRAHIIPCHPDFHSIMEAMPLSISRYFFTSPTSRTEGYRYTRRILARLWKQACKETGEVILMYAGLKHSTCSQYVNEVGMSLSDLQVITDHARMDSVKKYAHVGLARKRELMMGKIITFPKRPPRTSEEG